MQPGKPKIGEDTVVFLDKDTGKATITFQFDNYDIDGMVGVYLIRNSSTRILVPLAGKTNPFYVESTGTSQPKRYTISCALTKEDYWDNFRKTYPVFKFKVEMMDNPRVFSETNEFKVVY